jgi:hypothetical protein
MGRLGWFRKPRPKKKRICIACGEQIKRKDKRTEFYGTWKHIDRENPTGTNNEVQETLPL